jgi:hypothetical protein
MSRHSSNNTQLTLRVPGDWQALADELATLMSRPGVPMSRSDAYRAAIARGLEVLRAEYSAETKGAAPARKPAK